MDNRYEIAEQNGMSREFADWFFDNKKAGCGNVWFMMMAAMWEGWQGRAAMLQGAEPVTTAYKLPAIGWLRADYQDDNRGLRGNAPLFVLGKKDPSTVWGLDYIPLTSNSPVIPDGWVLVPVDATRAMIDAAARVEEDGYDAMHKAMIAAAPQQEVK
ncbi:hypothetical protein [Enterobacter hormaechei]|uniref:hypothetical protein n=1 Tax=Enterobacter hormaechei TaxID=158836 RepID=UPI00125B95E8|nr:hypothetical protein [Enterobacter hormaechei]VAG78090.1 Uncharacterised protein [Enterobacter hormaechei]